ncbi:MAG: MFS transporter [Rhodospirillaceae bacterium]|jgi:MFS family permease
MENNAPTTPEKPKSFVALRHPGARMYLIGAGLAMMADFVEHVITYWVLWNKFESQWLNGFATFSHWVPFLLFSFWAGWLADRFDPRRVIQCGMGLFMFVSFAWGMLFLFDVLEMWHAGVLLVLHGMAGVLWSPAGQVLVHDIVGGAQLQSAVRMLATSRTLGLLLGPAVGSGLMILMGPVWGIFFNVLIYLPLTIWLWKAPYGPGFRKELKPARRGLGGFGEAIKTIKAISGNSVIVSMTLLAATTSFIVGNAYQAFVPKFAIDLGAGDAGLLYGLLLSANAAGAVISGVVLETKDFLRNTPRTAYIVACLWCLAMAVFAFTPNYVVAWSAMFIAGFLNLAYNSISRTLTQLNAPSEIRGQVIGVYNMADLGLRSFSGLVLGFAGSMMGIHIGLSVTAGLLLLSLVILIAVLGPRIATQTTS